MVHAAWKLAFDDVTDSLLRGFYQGWDLHPAQLPVRYAAVFAFFLAGIDAAAERLRTFVQKAAQATLVGDVFDDAATGQGLWTPELPYPAPCSEPGMFAVPCFRPGALPVFVLVTDAAFHNGPVAAHTYDPAVAGGTKTYAEAVNALDAIHARVIGVPVAGQNPGAARADLSDLAKATGSLYHDPAFGGTDRPLVPDIDVASGEVSNEVVRLIGLLAGAGLHDVTTTKASYACPGGVDCTGDGAADLAYQNPELSPGDGPYDASNLITKVATVASQANPLPYGSLDDKTFFNVRGDAEVTFRVHAKNDALKPTKLIVLRALIRVETPSGQVLGGKDGIKLVYFVIPEFITTTN